MAIFGKESKLTEKQQEAAKRVLKKLDSNDIKWILKTVFESRNVWGSDIEQAVKTINKLKDKLKEMQDDAIINQIK
tara:strand:- start:164 stop:391 length:228 start_codon:yes stop_codon:yes gene_type:complete